MKYVMINRNGDRLPVVFPDDLTHSEISSTEGPVVSAGFCHISGDHLRVLPGRSESLDLDPHPTDELNLHIRILRGLTSLDIMNLSAKALMEHGRHP